MPEQILDSMRPRNISDAEFNRRCDKLINDIAKPIPAFVWTEQDDGSSICCLGSFTVAEVRHASGGQYRAWDMLQFHGKTIGFYSRRDLAEQAAEQHIAKYLEETPDVS